MDKYVSHEKLYSLLASDEVLLFCPPWSCMRRQRRQKSLHTGLLYRFGFRRLGNGDLASPSLNSQWVPLSVYHNNLLPNNEVCIVHLPHKPVVVTYLDVLHQPTLRLSSFVHIPDIPVTVSNSYTPFPVLEKERNFTTQDMARSERFNIARAVDVDVSRCVVEEFIDKIAEASPDTMFPLQGTLDGYYWKGPRHWLNVEPRLKQFHEQDHIYMLADVVLQMKNIILDAFCAKAEETAIISKVFFHAATSSLHRNIRPLPMLSVADMQSVASDANDSLTVKALMCSTVIQDEEYGDGLGSENRFQPLVNLVSNPWLLFAIRAFLPRDSSLLAMLQSSKRLEPIDRAIVFTVREISVSGSEYVRFWADTPVDITIEGCSQEGIPSVTITSPIVAQLDNDGTLGRLMAENGGISSTHGQTQHTTTIILTGEASYIYNDTLPFLIKVCKWDKSELQGKLDRLMQKLQGLLTDSHAFRNEPTTEEVL